MKDEPTDMDGRNEDREAREEEMAYYRHFENLKLTEFAWMIA